MTAEEYLGQIQRIDLLIQNKQIEREQWKSIALSSTSGGQSVWLEVKGKKELHNMDKVQSSGTMSKMADAVNRYSDIDKEIDKLIDKLIDTKIEIISTIEKLTPIEYDILHKVYIQGMTLKDAGEAWNKTKGWAKGVHKRAKIELQQILDERTSKKCNLFDPV